MPRRLTIVFLIELAGADDFLPVYVYVVLRAAVPSLWSNIEFIQTYRDPSELLGQYARHKSSSLTAYTASQDPYRIQKEVAPFAPAAASV